jgi:hypothetical protein
VPSRCSLNTNLFFLNHLKGSHAILTNPMQFTPKEEKLSSGCESRNANGVGCGGFFLGPIRSTCCLSCAGSRWSGRATLPLILSPLIKVVEFPEESDRLSRRGQNQS